MAEDFAGCRVLVVEDELMIAMGLEVYLSHLGCEVVGPVGEVGPALEAARSAAVDMALLDINLRGEEVYPVADALAERGIPFAFLTGYDRSSVPTHYRAPVLAKPFQPPQLVTALASLNNHRGAKGSTLRPPG
jgi:CheY-like chemotaxis protein